MNDYIADTSRNTQRLLRTYRGGDDRQQAAWVVITYIKNANSLILILILRIFEKKTSVN